MPGAEPRTLPRDSRGTRWSWVPRGLDGLARAVAALACLVFLLRLSDSARVQLPPAQVEALAVSALVEVMARLPGTDVDTGGVDAPGGVASTTRAVAGAELWFHREREGRYEYVAHVATDARGRVAARLPPGRYWVVVGAEGYAREAREIDLWSDREWSHELAAASELVVTVSSDGRAVPNASVLVQGKSALPAGARSDERGRAVFDGLFSGPYQVRVAAPGYEPFEAETTGDLEVQLTRTLALRVVVRDPSGKTVAGAHVTLAGPGLWPARSVDTGADGSVTISGLSRGSFDVVARDATRVSETLRGVYVGTTGSDSGARSLELVLLPGRFLRALVVSDASEPVSRAELVLAEEGVAQIPLVAQSGDDGRAVVGPLGYRRAFVAVRADGFVPRTLWVESEALGSEAPVRIELARAATLSGRVVDERGFPVEAAALEVIGTDVYGMPVAMTPDTTAVRKRHFAELLEGPRPLVAAGELGVMPGPVPPIPLAGARVAVASSVDVWATGGDGRFVARGVSPGELRVIARHPEYVEGVSEAVRVAPGGRAEVEVVMRTGRRLEGRVRDADGFPAARTRVRLTAARGAFDRTLVTEPDGSFVVPVAPQELVVSVYSIDDPLRVALRKRITLDPMGVERVELELPKPREEVRLRVTDEREEPVSLAQVTVLSLDPEAPLRETRFTSGDGQVALRDAAGLHVRVVVEAPGFAQLEHTFRSLPEEGALRLGRSVTVTGRATAVRGRQPAAGARVTLRAPGGKRETTTDEFGAYTLRDVAPGRVTVTIEHKELGRATLDAVVTRDERDRPFELPSAELELAGSVRGRVVDARGEPVAGARVAVGVVPLYLPQGTLPEGIAVSDGRGEFVLERVAAGTHRLSAYSRAAGRGSSPSFQLEPGEERRDVEIRLTEPPEAASDEFRAGVAITLGERDERHGVAVVVVHVVEGSEAQRGGLAPGDVITKVDGVPVDSMAAARRALGGPAASDVVVSVLRDGARRELRVTRESVSQ